MSEVFPYLPSTDTFCENLARKSIQGATFDSGTEKKFLTVNLKVALDPGGASCTRSLCDMWRGDGPPLSGGPTHYDAKIWTHTFWGFFSLLSHFERGA